MAQPAAGRALVVVTAVAGNRKALCIIRSLARAGIRPVVATATGGSRASLSRHAERYLSVPHPGRDPEGFDEAIRDITAADRYDALLPASDITTAAMSRLQGELPAAPVPGKGAWEVFKDKHATMELAAGLGVAVPATYCPRDTDELEELMPELPFPCVLKPRRGAGGFGVTVLASPAELRRAYRSLPSLSDAVFDFTRPLIQEYIPGEVHEVCALFRHGQPRALLTQKRLLMYPRKGGVGIYNETTDEPELKEMAVRLLQANDWHGPAQVEFKRDERSGQAYLMEVNGRFWGTLDLAVAAGMNFPLMAYRMAAEGDVAMQSDYRVGMRFRWPFPYAVMHAIETGRWLASFRDFLLPHRATRSNLLLSDPMPLITEAGNFLKRYRSRRSGC